MKETTGSRNEPDFPYEVIDGIAYIEVAGALEKAPNLASSVMGWSTYADLSDAIALADLDEDVRSILVVVDSPGGAVDGIEGPANALFSAEKPTVAVIDGIGASAAYYIASAADHVVASRTSMVGSIGVVMTSWDLSRFYESIGVKKNVISSGPLKTAGDESKPMTPETEEYFQELVDQYHQMFVGAVARHRSMPVSAVNDIATGRVWLAEDAMRLGMIDHVGDIGYAVEWLRAKGGINMDREAFRVEYPEVWAEAVRVGADGVDVDAVAEAAMASERGRVIALLESGADNATVMACIRDGIELSAAYERFYRAEVSRRSKGLAELEASAPDPVTPMNGGRVDGSYTEVLNRMVAGGLSRASAMAAIRRDRPEIHEEYIRSINKEE